MIKNVLADGSYLTPRTSRARDAAHGAEVFAKLEISYDYSWHYSTARATIDS